MSKRNTVIYIGDFDLRNENVQSFLVKNNAKILRALGFDVAFIGINSHVSTFGELSSLEKLRMEEGYSYLELPNTLNLVGLLKVFNVYKTIVNYLDKVSSVSTIQYLISYQCPSYSILLKWIIKWCKQNSVKYIVNCADLPVFDNQPILRKQIMAINWSYLHSINKKNADGVIAVSKYISEFYRNGRCKSVIIPPLFDLSLSFDIKDRETIPVFVYAGIPFKANGRLVCENGMKDRLDLIIDLFLNLAKEGIPFAFRILGISKKDYLIGVPRQAEALKECESIEFLGHLEHEESLQIVSMADFSINYRDENRMTKAGFSTKIVESISVGTPVIINSISDTFDYVIDGKTGFMLTADDAYNMTLIKGLCYLPIEERKKIKRDVLESKVFDFHSYVTIMKAFLADVNQFPIFGKESELKENDFS